MSSSSSLSSLLLYSLSWLQLYNYYYYCHHYNHHNHYLLTKPCRGFSMRVSCPKYSTQFLSLSTCLCRRRWKFCSSRTIMKHSRRSSPDSPKLPTARCHTQQLALVNSINPIQFYSIQLIGNSSSSSISSSSHHHICHHHTSHHCYHHYCLWPCLEHSILVLRQYLPQVQSTRCFLAILVSSFPNSYLLYSFF